MAVAKRKPTAITETAPAKPIFRVLPKPEPPATGGVKKLNLGSLVKTSTEKKSDHPYITAPSAELLETLESFAQESPKLKALKGTVESLSKQAGALGKPFWFGHWHGRGDAGSTMLVKISTGDVKLVFKNAYTTKMADDGPLISLIGADRTAASFEQATELKIKMDEIPEPLRQPFIEAILEKAQELGITSGIEAKQFIKPAAGIHESRHTIFTPEENLAIDNILPITAYPQL